MLGFTARCHCECFSSFQLPPCPLHPRSTIASYKRPRRTIQLRMEGSLLPRGRTTFCTPTREQIQVFKTEQNALQGGLSPDDLAVSLSGFVGYCPSAFFPRIPRRRDGSQHSTWNLTDQRKKRSRPGGLGSRVSVPRTFGGWTGSIHLVNKYRTAVRPMPVVRSHAISSKIRGRRPRVTCTRASRRRPACPMRLPLLRLARLSRQPRKISSSG